jgi:8-oxo-dGTP pyrophosphatase MutT (NUDIX family)
MLGKSLAEAAAQEAYEEAGVSGVVEPRSIGRFMYRKRRFFGALVVEVVVHPLAVSEELESWPERGQRSRRWVSAKTAVAMVQSRELGRIIAELARRARDHPR